MKIKTDLKAGLQPGQCHKVYNRFGQCKKIMCPYPPFKFPCYQTGLVQPDSPIYYETGTDGEDGGFE